EVDEQQDQRDNQRDEQATDGPVAAQSREDAGGVKIFHFLGPYLAYRMLLEVLKCCAPATAGPPPSDQTATSRNAWSRANARKLNIIDTCSPVEAPTTKGLNCCGRSGTEVVKLLTGKCCMPNSSSTSRPTKISSRSSTSTRRCLRGALLVAPKNWLRSMIGRSLPRTLATPLTQGLTLGSAV